MESRRPPLPRLGRESRGFMGAAVPGFLAVVLLAAPVRAEGPKPALVRSVLHLDPEIDCPSCEDYIKHTLVTAHGVRSAEIDVIANRIVVCYDPASIKLQALIGRIRVYGYTATEVK